MFDLRTTRLIAGLPVLLVANAQALSISLPVAAESQLRAIHHRQISAHAGGEANVLDALTAVDFQFTNQSGEWLDRAHYLGSGHAPRAHRFVSHEDVRVRRFGAIALVHGLYQPPAGSDDPAPVRYTTVYHWSGGSWQLVSAQDTLLRQGAPREQRKGRAPAHAPWKGVDPIGDDLAVLRQLNDNYVRAFREADVAWYDAHLAADYVVINSDGSFDDRAEALASFAQPHFATHIRSFPVDKVQIRLFGDIALIRAENDFVMKDGRRGINRYTDIWRKNEAGRWQCIAAHITTFRAVS